MADPHSSDNALAQILAVDEFEAHARALLPAAAYEYISAGAADEWTLRATRDAWNEILLRPRMLREIADVDLAVTLFGTRHAFPILVAPTAFHRAFHPDGEVATARGAGAAGATWVLSSATTSTFEEVASAASTPWWFQLYMQPVRDATRTLVLKAEDGGCQAICLTVDTPVLGVRDRQVRAGFKLPNGLTAPYMAQLAPGGHTISDLWRGVPVTWRDVEWLRSVTRLPLLLKGILDADDARLALESGVSGIIVSNHGARNLDTVPPTIVALPEIAERMGGKMPILIDGGVRRGTDVVKAIALGASAVLVGRPICYALAVGGAAGVQRALDILRTELAIVMRLMGLGSIAEIGPAALWEQQEHRPQT